MRRTHRRPSVCRRRGAGSSSAAVWSPRPKCGGRRGSNKPRGDAKTMSEFRQVGRAEMPGGGQVTVQGKYAYVGHMGPPHGTSILDVSDPKNPRVISEIEVPHHTHSHKVRVHGDTMLINYEQYGRLDPEFRGGMKIFDIADKAKPREIAFFQCDGGGMHRFDYEAPTPTSRPRCKDSTAT